MTTTQDASSRSAQLEQFIDDVFSRGTVMGRSGETRDIFPTGLRRAAGERLYETVLQEGATRTIETGFAFGLSGLFICKALLAGGGEGARHVAADPWQEKGYDDAGLVTFEEAGLSSLLEFHRRQSGFLLPELVEEGRTFDLAFVDGGHLFEVVFLDLYYLSRLVEPGGLIIVDDMWMPSVRLAVDFCVENLRIVHENRVNPHHVMRRRIRSVLHLQRRHKPKEQEPVAYLRTPDKPMGRAWDHFQPFDHRY